MCLGSYTFERNYFYKSILREKCLILFKKRFIVIETNQGRKFNEVDLKIYKILREKQKIRKVKRNKNKL